MSDFLTALLDQAKKIIEPKKQFDPTIFGDPLANTIERTPLVGGGNNVVTHRFRQETPFQVQFKMALGGRSFVLIFLLPGIACGLFCLYIILQKTKAVDPIFLGGCGLFFVVFTTVGILMLKKYHSPIIFDKGIGMFRKGKLTFESMTPEGNQKSSTSLKEIHAIQLIGEWCYGGKTSYNSYELNVVLNDGKRINVVDHKGMRQLREDAQKLGIFLGVPVWDGI